VDAATSERGADRLQGGKVCRDIEDYLLS